MSNQKEDAKAWVIKYLGKSFVRGVAINKQYATVIVRTEGGKEIETRISLPQPMKDGELI